MVMDHTIVITNDDYEKICTILKYAKPEVAELLEDELERARIVSKSDLPPETVSMNSRIHFLDNQTGKDFVATLVYPNDANIDENKISVLAPIGAALIGLKVGQTIDWPLPNGSVKKIKVISVSNNDQILRKAL